MANENETEQDQEPSKSSKSWSKRPLIEVLAEMRGQILRRQADLATDPKKRGQDECLSRAAGALLEAIVLEEADALDAKATG